MIVCAECGKELDIVPDADDETWLCSACSRPTRAVPGGVKRVDRLIDEGSEAIRLTPHTADRAEARAGDGAGDSRAAADV